MITTEHQFRITKSEIKSFEEALSKVAEQNKDLHPKLQTAVRESLDSQLQELCEQVAEYEALRDGKITSLEFDSLAQSKIP